MSRRLLIPSIAQCKAVTLWSLMYILQYYFLGFHAAVQNGGWWRESNMQYTFTVDFNTVCCRPKKQLAIHVLSPACTQEWSPRKLAFTLLLCHLDGTCGTGWHLPCYSPETASAFRPNKNNDPSSESCNLSPFIIYDSCFNSVTLGIQLTHPADWISTVLKPPAFSSKVWKTWCFFIFFLFFLFNVCKRNVTYKIYGWPNGKPGLGL